MICGESCKCVDCKNCADISGGGGGEPASTSKPRAKATKAVTASKVSWRGRQASETAMAIGLLQEEEEEMAMAGRDSSNGKRHSASFKAMMSATSVEEAGQCGGWGDEFDVAAAAGMASVFQVRKQGHWSH